MWISKEQYDRLKMYEGMIVTYESRIKVLQSGSTILAKECAQYKDELEEKRIELEKYKQKYADEVQKRLALINQLGE